MRGECAAGPIVTLNDGLEMKKSTEGYLGTPNRHWRVTDTPNGGSDPDRRVIQLVVGEQTVRMTNPWRPNWQRPCRDRIRSN